MHRILIVANQTLGGELLQKEIRSRLNDGPCSFFVVVPQTPPADLAFGYIPSEPGIGADLRAQAIEQAHEEAVKHARGRLDRLTSEITEAGGVAEGVLGDPDPVRAVEAELGRGFDEIIVSTLPATLSKWLKLDLPSRLERRVDIPVTTVIPD